MKCYPSLNVCIRGNRLIGGRQGICARSIGCNAKSIGLLLLKNIGVFIQFTGNVPVEKACMENVASQIKQHTIDQV